MTHDRNRTTTAERATLPDPEATATSQEVATDVLRILHVEDNPADALLMQEYLRGVLGAVSFDTAVRLAELSPDRAAGADCALLDLSLPDASGLEGVSALREMSDNLPIIVLTGFDDLELGLAAVRGGADDYLVKSHVDGYSLERAVQYAIGRRQLLLQVASSNFAAESATRAAKAARGTSGASVDTAVGTHEVSVRVDGSTGDFALRCNSCNWEAERGADVLHSWNDRGLDVVLLHHIDYSGLGRQAAAEPAPDDPAVDRRRLMRPGTWLPVRHGMNRRPDDTSSA